MNRSSMRNRTLPIRMKDSGTTLKLVIWQQLHWLISQPFLYSNEESGRGDLLLGLGLHSDFLREKIHSLTLGGVRLPTADSVVEPREFNQLLFAQKLFVIGTETNPLPWCWLHSKGRGSEKL